MGRGLNPKTKIKKNRRYKSMTREDLKNYKYNQEWIKGRLEYIEQYKESITNVTRALSDMPKRKWKSRR